MSTYSSLFLAERSLITYSQHECNKIEAHKEEYTILRVMFTKGFIPACRIMMLFQRSKSVVQKDETQCRHCTVVIYISGIT